MVEYAIYSTFLILLMFLLYLRVIVLHCLKEFVVCSHAFP